MKKYKIRDEFSQLKEFIINLPVTFDNIGLVIVDNRNIVKKVITEQETLVIKNFRGMYFFNRLAYSLFKKSKAERSYINSAILNDKGFLTPPNIAWMDHYKWGLLSQSYYLSGYSPFQTLRQVIDNNMHDEQFKKLIYKDLLSFIVKLHEVGVCHYDFSLRNILVIPTDGGYQFSMVDLNRVRFQHMTFREGLRNFHKLEIPVEDMNKLISAYAIQAGQNPEESVALFWADTQRTMFRRRIRKNLRKYTLTPLEKLIKG